MRFKGEALGADKEEGRNQGPFSLAKLKIFTLRSIQNRTTILLNSSQVHRHRRAVFGLLRQARERSHRAAAYRVATPEPTEPMLLVERAEAEPGSQRASGRPRR